jgi:Protein of unknown function (DUF2827)
MSAGHSVIVSNANKGIIILATGLITQETLFNNGLQQNSLALYNLFESMGYTCYCITEKGGVGLEGYRFYEPEAFLMQKGLIGVVWYIEIGLSLDMGWRQAVRQAGGKVAKLYLGNVLNIDIETVHMTPGLTFAHHIPGGIDCVWTSPHYGQNLAYLTALNGVQASVVPYIWDKRWLSPKGWVGGTDWRTTDIVISEPNLSFQKNALYPVLLAMAYMKAVPEWQGRIIVHNSKLLLANAFWSRFHSQRLQFRERLTVGGLIEAHPSAVFIQHQYNNEYNYMTLELMLRGFPVLHNSKSWDAGYQWSIDDFAASVGLLTEVMRNHRNREDYIPKALALIYQFSPTNPRVIADWAAILSQPKSSSR